MKRIEKTAKNADEALRQAAEEFGVSVQELGHEVIQEVGKGLIGFLIGKEVTISAWLKKDEPKPVVKPEIEPKANAEVKPVKSAAKTEFKTSGNNMNKKSEEPSIKADRSVPQKTVTKHVTPVADSTASDSRPAFEKSSLLSKGNGKNDVKRGERRPPRTYAKITDDIVSDVTAFLSELLNKMGIEHSLSATINDDTLNVDVSGEKMGLLIGKRGDTLDSVQYLTSLFVNKGKEGYIKVSIDTENYRKKREETLVRLAHSLERRVLSNRRQITLEPMSPYERRIIHAALQGNTKIKTYSVGNEPNRKIVVTLA